MRCPARQVGTLARLEVRHDHQSPTIFLRGGDDRSLDVARAGGQYLSALETIPPALGCQAQRVGATRVPHAEQLSLADLASDQEHLFAAAVSKRQADRVDMAFEKPPEGQASSADFSENLAPRQSADYSPAQLARQRRG